MVVLNSTIEVGKPSKDFNEANRWIVTPVHFHGFEELPTARGHDVGSPVFECVGCKWRLVVWPGGYGSSVRGWVAIWLDLISNDSDAANIIFRISAKDSKGDDVAVSSFESITPYCHWVYDDNFAKLSTIIDNLVNGTLILEVRTRSLDSSSSAPPFIAENPHGNKMLQLFMDDDSADAVFEVHDENDASSKIKKLFYAHRLILKQCAPLLDELCGSGSNTHSVPISDVTPGIFDKMLYYVYGGKIEDETFESSAKEILDAADKYGVVNLKLEAEVWLVKTTKINGRNMMELLLYADAKHCALLNEAVMDFIMENRSEVLEYASFHDAPRSLGSDILAATLRKDSDGEDGDFTVMRICELRKKLHEKGLDVDGSRGMLIARLKDNADKTSPF
ncbi:hypothetical protein ACHAWF_003741 [Thalassiosira exigua]